MTTTTLGYGETYVSTHLGRFVSILTGFSGLILSSLMTASLRYSAQDHLELPFLFDILTTHFSHSHY